MPKKVKDANLPKRAKSPYVFFVQKNFQVFKSKNPGASTTQLMPMMATAWKSATAAIKGEMERLSAKDNERYRSEMREYEKRFPDQKAAKRYRKKGVGAPLRARSPYIFFVQSIHDRIKREKPHLSHAELIQEIAKRWNALSNSDKEPFVRKSATDKNRYEAEAKKFKASGAALESTATVASPKPVPASPKPAKKVSVPKSPKVKKVKTPKSPKKAKSPTKPKATKKPKSPPKKVKSPKKAKSPKKTKKAKK